MFFTQELAGIEAGYVQRKDQSREAERLELGPEAVKGTGRARVRDRNCG